MKKKSGVSRDASLFDEESDKITYSPYYRVVDVGRIKKKKNRNKKSDKSKKSTNRESSSKRYVIFSPRSREIQQETLVNPNRKSASNTDAESTSPPSSKSSSILKPILIDRIDNESKPFRNVTFIEAIQEVLTDELLLANESSLSFSNSVSFDQQSFDSFLRKQEETEEEDKNTHFIVEYSNPDGEISGVFCSPCYPYSPFDCEDEARDIQEERGEERTDNEDDESNTNHDEGKRTQTELRDDVEDTLTLTHSSSSNGGVESKMAKAEAPQPADANESSSRPSAEAQSPELVQSSAEENKKIEEVKVDVDHEDETLATVRPSLIEIGREKEDEKPATTDATVNGQNKHIDDIDSTNQNARDTEKGGSSVQFLSSKWKNLRRKSSFRFLTMLHMRKKKKQISIEKKTSATEEEDQDEIEIVSANDNRVNGIAELKKLRLLTMVPIRKKKKQISIEKKTSATEEEDEIASANENNVNDSDSVAELKKLLGAMTTLKSSLERYEERYDKTKAEI